MLAFFGLFEPNLWMAHDSSHNRHPEHLSGTTVSLFIVVPYLAYPYPARVQCVTGVDTPLFGVQPRHHRTEFRANFLDQMFLLHPFERI